MRILIISDIHSNLTALEAVLSNAGQVDAVWCLGDLVGYGPDPNECVRTIKQLPNLVCLLGNHDAAVAGIIDNASFNNEARIAVLWTKSVLSKDNQDFLQSLTPQTVLDSVTLAHGSPRQPIWEYLLDVHTATANFAHFDTPYCFVGHSHLPVIYERQYDIQNARLLIPEVNSSRDMAPRAIMNPGSVGQPRDRDPRASYAIFDPQALTWSYQRIAYDVPSVQSRMQSAHLPQRHIQRLSTGW
jgi:predicted phosphodiesterase